jgi:hypothetical protein
MIYATYCHASPKENPLTVLTPALYCNMNSSGVGGGGGKGGRSWRTPPDDALVVADSTTGKKVSYEFRISLQVIR